MLYQRDTFLLDPLFVHVTGTQQHLRFLRIHARNLGSRSGIFDAVLGLGPSLLPDLIAVFPRLEQLILLIPTSGAFVDIVSRTRPERVELHLVYAPEDPDAQGDTPAYGGVSHLLVHFVIEATPGPTPSTSDVLRTLAPFLANFSQYDRLDIKLLLYELDEDSGVHGNAGESVVDAAMAAIDVAALVSGLAASEMHLQTIVLDRVPVTRAGYQSVWEIDKADGEQTLRKLGPEVRGQVFAREEPMSFGHGTSGIF
ncbi:hypothetical protein C8Q80DRAFT_1274126 [Daedaleopsis nitida]|nr:hypothetical protein C8Q80DRAFT_1274126 [Daedaleopsis nitida]